MAINSEQFRTDMQAAMDTPESRAWFEKEWHRWKAMTPEQRAAEKRKQDAEWQQRQRDFAVYLCTYMGGNRRAWEEYKGNR